MRLLGRRPVLLDIVDRGLELAARASHHTDETLLQRGREIARFLVRIGGDDIDARHRMRRRELFGRLEALAIDGERLHQRIRREMRGKAVGQSELGRELRAEQARPENPERNLKPLARHSADRLIGSRRREQRLQFEHVLREAVG